jgi:hypothetical protein
MRAAPLDLRWATLPAARARTAAMNCAGVWGTSAVWLLSSMSTAGGRDAGVISVSFFAGVLGARRLELLRQLLPKATTIETD